MKVLFVDDDAMMLRMAGFIAKKSGFEAVLAGSGDEGTEAFLNHRPPVIFIDIEMPDKNGFETLEELKKAGLGDARVYMMSGTVDDDVRDRAERAGACAVIEKPLNAAEVTKVING